MIGVLATFVVTLGQAESAIVNAKSVSLSEVVSAIRLAREGDTVVVPAGTASWASTLTITKGITLQGAGDDKTVILDDVARTPLNKGGAILIADLNPKQSFRLTGITFRAGSLTTRGNNGAVRIRGTCSAVRIDHCHFDSLHQLCVHTYGSIFGVIDHCTFDCTRGSLAILVWHDTWGNKAHGDGSWNDLPYFGSEKFLFIEDNTFNNFGAKQTNGNIDAKNGARYVARYNKFNNCMPNSHGTEGGPQTGVRAIEIYNNRFHWTFHSTGGQLRSGTALIYDNISTGIAPAYAKVLQQYRIITNDAPLGPASGSNEWDLNDTEGNGTNAPGRRPFVYASGTASQSGRLSLTVSPSPNWAPNEWVNYEVTNLDQHKNAGYPTSSYIISNTSDTLRFAAASQGPSLEFKPGNRFRIHKLLVSVDQPGRGKRDLIRNSKGLTGPPKWSNQMSEPVYGWNNKYVDSNKIASPVYVHSVGPTIQENRDFYNQRPSFDGTAGLGVGKLADRPQTCTPGVAYWATDQGEWDSTHDGPDGQLYVCSVPNTWKLYYKPYTYPHPLVSSMPPQGNTTGNGQGTTDAASRSNK